MLLPQPFSGELTNNRGNTGQASKACTATTHKRHRDRLALAKHDVAPDGRRQRVEQRGAVYRLRPRLRRRKIERAALAGNGAAVGVFRGNSFVQDRDRTAEPLGGCFPLAAILDQRQSREPRDLRRGVDFAARLIRRCWRPWDRRLQQPGERVGRGVLGERVGDILSFRPFRRHRDDRNRSRARSHRQRRHVRRIAAARLVIVGPDDHLAAGEWRPIGVLCGAGAAHRRCADVAGEQRRHQVGFLFAFALR